MVNRFQLLVGASAYLTSPMWLALMMVVLVGQSLGAWEATTILPSNGLLLLTIALLFGPKLLALGWALANPARRVSFGGARSLVGSVLFETILSILMAPVSMLTQTINLFSIMIGRKSAWNGQTRDRDGMSIVEALWIFKYHLLLAAAMLGLAIYGGLAIGWLMPVVVGLALAPALAALTARKDLGRYAADHGLFKVPIPWWKVREVPLKANVSSVAKSLPEVEPPAALAANDF
jgi:membrane glycosyltransferase